MLAVFTILPLTMHAQNSDELFESVRYSKLYTLNKIVSNGTDINQVDRSKNTPLMVAAKIGDRLIVETLLKNEADPNITNGAGATALMIAAKYGHSHVIENLLLHNADPLIKNNSGIRASQFALAYGHKEVFRQLLDAENEALKGRQELTRTTS